MRRTIANGHTPVNATNLDDFAFQSNDLAHWIGMADERSQTIDRGAGANHVKMELRPQEDAGGGGKAARPVKESKGTERRPEGAELAPIERMAGFVGTGKMAHHQRDLETAEEASVGGELCHLVRGEAQAIDAGIDMERGRSALAGLSPGGDLVEAAQ